MFHYQLVTNLNESQLSDGHKLALKVLGENVHPKRVRGFILSRVALQKALESFGVSCPLSSLTLEKYSQVSGIENLTISLSHHPNAGAALVAERNLFPAVGIDIEETMREVKIAVRDRIAHPEDENFRNIELWCAKEAAFKALMNTGNFDLPIEFSSIRISKDHWYHSPSKIEGEWKLLQIDSTMLALAFLKN